MKEHTEQEQTDNESTNSASKTASRIGAIFKENRNVFLLILGTLTAAVLIFTTVYFLVFHQSSLDEYAEQFCSCAEASQSDFYNYSKDGFGYRSDMQGCFADDFKNYSAHFNKMEKQRLVKEFQQKVIEKCPQKLSLIFEYK
jgi:hypothetical protein